MFSKDGAPAGSPPAGNGEAAGDPGPEQDPALMGVQDKIIKLTREQTGERQQHLTGLKEEQRRLQVGSTGLEGTCGVHALLRRAYG